MMMLNDLRNGSLNIVVVARFLFQADDLFSFPYRMRNLRHSFFPRDSKISVGQHQMSKKS